MVLCQQSDRLSICTCVVAACTSVAFLSDFAMLLPGSCECGLTCATHPRIYAHSAIQRCAGTTSCRVLQRPSARGSWEHGLHC